MVGLEDNGKAMPKKKNKGQMGSGPSANKIFDPNDLVPIFNKDLYADLEKIEERGKRKKGFSIFSRNKK